MVPSRWLKPAAIGLTRLLMVSAALGAEIKQRRFFSQIQGPFANRLENDLTVGTHRLARHDQDGKGRVGHHLDNGLMTVGPRHLKVDDQEMGSRFLYDLLGVFAASRLADDFNVALRLEKMGQLHATNGRIIQYDDTNGFHDAPGK